MALLRTPTLDLDGILLADRGRLIALAKKRQDSARQKKPLEPLDKQLADALATARERLAARTHRHTAIAHPDFDDALPIAERRAEIADLIANNQVVILCGETGSG